MSFLAVTALLCLCASTGLATYGPEYNNNNHHDNGPGHYGGGGGGKLEEPRIHLNSPKIILDRPSISVHGAAPAHHHHHSPLHEDEPIILENEEPLYIRKTLHAAAPVHHPVLLDAGYSHGKVIDISAPIQVINHAPIVQERPVLIRRPVIVSKALTTSQDHLEKLHYGHQYGHALHHGYGHHAAYAIPVARALHEKTVVYSNVGPTHHHVIPAVYSAPLILDHQHHHAKAHHVDLGHHHGHGPAHHGGNGGHHKKY